MQKVADAYAWARDKIVAAAVWIYDHPKLSLFIAGAVAGRLSGWLI